MRNGVIRKHKVKSKDERVQNNVWSQIIIIIITEYIEKFSLNGSRRADNKNFFTLLFP